MAGDKPSASSLNSDIPNYCTINIKTYVPLVLDLNELNYDAWKELFQTHCRSFGVLDYITDRSIGGHEWQRMDSLVKLWIYGTISSFLLTMVLKRDTSARDVWVCLESLFRDNKELHNDLRNITLGGDETISDYCQRIKSISDRLANMNSPVDKKALVTYMVNGLTERFENVAGIIRHQTPLPGFLKARSMLVLEEQKLSRGQNNSGSHSAKYSSSSSSSSLVSSVQEDRSVESSDARDVSVPIEELEYMHASNVNVSDFVTVKFSKRNFPIWRDQMLCLMKSQRMDGMLEEDDTAWRRDKDDKLIERYDHLLKGWISGSILLGKGINEELLDRTNIYQVSAKELWKTLEEGYQTGIVPILFGDEFFQFPNTDQEQENNTYDTSKLKKELYDATLKGSWWTAKLILIRNKELAATEEISTNGDTMLHIAVREGNNYFFQKLLNFIKDAELIEKVIQYGQTSLHIAAETGNTEAAKLLVEKRKKLLDIRDHDDIVPLVTAFTNWQPHTFVYLSEVTENRDDYLSSHEDRMDSDSAVAMIAGAISKKQYDIAIKLYSVFDKKIKNYDMALLELTRNIPSELGFGEALIYPSFENFNQSIVKRSSLLFNSFEYSYKRVESALWSMNWFKKYYSCELLTETIMILLIPIVVLYPIYQLILHLILVLLFPLFMLYFLLWKALAFVVPTIKSIDNKTKKYKQAQHIMDLIFKCYQTTDYERSIPKMAILEAIRLDAYSVFHQFPRSVSKKISRFHGLEMMQVAITNRSIKAYKLLNRLIDPGVYNTVIFGSTDYNLVHVAAKLPPLDILRCTRGAALQLQRELQWFEVLTERNEDSETPEMVFTREHADLVKEGENWMKTTAESCSITAALIVTIVFAAAITVPGGNNQETGIPLFRKEIAFTLFAVCDAISLFTGATSLSVFLSILTTRFAEKDFLVVLPRRLLIALILLLLSTTTMMVAFSSILYLVFCDQRPWMLVPIGALACVPIAAIVFLQFPLMFDLFHSTYFPIFGKEQRKRFNLKRE